MENFKKLLFNKRIYVIGICFIGFLIYSGHFYHLIDEDAFIVARYAENLAHGYGFVFNPGDETVEGFSNHLWLWIWAILIKIGIPTFTSVRLMGILFGLLTVIFLYKLVERITSKHQTYWAVVSIITLMSSWYYGYWLTRGLEAPLSSFLIIWCVFKAIDNNVKFKDILLPVILTVLSRSEGIIITVFLFLPYIIYGYKRNKEKFQLGIKALLLSAVVYGIFNLLRILYFGRFYPETYTYKVYFMNTSYLMSKGMFYITEYFYGKGILFSILFILAFLYAVYIAVINLSFRKNSDHVPMISLLLCILIGWSVFLLKVGGDFFEAYRFMLPVFPIILAIIIYSFDQLSLNFKLIYKRLVMAFLFMIIIISSIYNEYKFKPDERVVYRGGIVPILSVDNFYDYGFKTFQEPVLPDSYRKVINQISNKFEPHSTIALSEAGMIPFELPEYNFIDYLGLNSKIISKIMVESSESDRIKEVVKYVLDQEPQGILLTGYIKNNKIEGRMAFDQLILDNPLFSENYKVVSTINIQGGIDSSYFLLYQKGNRPIDISAPTIIDFKSEPKNAEWYLSGFYPNEGTFRWASKKASVSLLLPERSNKLNVVGYVPSVDSDGVDIDFKIDGKQLYTEKLTKSGTFDLNMQLPKGLERNKIYKLDILVSDQIQSPNEDKRELAAAFSTIGFFR
jgi:hypothetical protein